VVARLDGVLHQVATKKPIARSRWSVRNLISYLLFAIAAGLFVVVAVMYYQDRNDKEDTPPTPPSIPGRAQMINVVNALKAQDLNAEFASTGGVFADGLTPPGQPLTVDGQSLYVFIFDDPSARESELTGFDTEDILLTASTTGEEVTTPVVHSVSGSNIFVVMTGGDDALFAKVDAAITGLP
jgi:hypothetical protein